MTSAPARRSPRASSTRRARGRRDGIRLEKDVAESVRAGPVGDLAEPDEVPGAVGLDPGDGQGNVLAFAVETGTPP